VCLVCLAKRRETRTKTCHDPQGKKKIAFPNCQGLNEVLLGSPANWRRARKWKKQAQRHRNVSEKQHHTPFLSLSLSLHCPLALSFVFVRSICDGNCFASVLVCALFSSSFRSFTLWR
jgi:hypothetical protein